MPRHYQQSIEISAGPQAVWRVMCEVTRWPEWTRSVRRVVPLTDGPMDIGSRVRVYQPGLPPATWRVTEWRPDHHFTWVSLAPGVRVTARHEVEAAGDGSRVVLSLYYGGGLGGWVARLFHRLNMEYLQWEARGLKARCEAPASG